MLNLLKTRKVECLSLILLIGLYFVLRLPHLTLQPIFADEAIYIRWAQVMVAEPTLRFLPVTDGKTPLFMWIMMPSFKFFVDPLLTGRILSVFAGAATLAGVFFLGWKFFNLRSGLWAALLVAVTPFIVFFDRLALVDSMLAAFSLWALILGLLVVKYLRVDLAMCLGYALGGALLTKTPAMFNFIALPFTILTTNFSRVGREKRFLKILLLWILAVGIALVMYNFLRLGPSFEKLNARNQDYVFSPLELVGRPLDPFIPHFHDVTEFFSKLVGIVGSLFVILGVILAIVKRNRVGLVILIWSLIPLLIEMAFLKTFTARYILSSIAPLLILAGWGISEIEKLMTARIKNKVLPALALFIVIVFYPLSFDYLLITAPAQAAVPVNDHKGYFEEWTAGYGFPEIAQFLIGKAQNGPVIVLTEGFFGTLPDGLEIYLEKYIHQAPKGHEIVVKGTGGIKIPEDIRKTALTSQVYFVANRSRLDPLPPGVELIKEFPKNKTYINSQEAIFLFKVLPEVKK